MSKRSTEREFLNGTTIGGDKPFFLIAGPCVMESRELLDQVAAEMVEITKRLGIFFIFKSSFDKANRSSIHSYRGPGLIEGIKNLEFIKSKYGLPVLTDVHEVEQINALKDVIDVYQIPAFLSRQTDLLEAAAKTGKWVNVKKGQFLAPADCKHIKEKIRECGSEKYLVTFMEVHPDPPSAKSDSTTQFYLNKTERLLTNLLKIDRLVKTGLVELD